MPSAAARFMHPRDRQSVALLMKPLIASSSRVDVDHIDAANHASGDADQRAGTIAPQPRDGRRVRDCVFVTVGRARAFIGSAWKDV